MTPKSKESFKISKYKHLIFKLEEPGYVAVKDFIDGMLTERFNLFKGGNVTLPSLSAYSGNVAIKKQKLDDVSKVMHYIPDHHKQFYENILT